MWRVVFYFLIIVAFAVGFVWMADRPGQVTINWLDYEIETSLMVLVGAGIFGLGLLWAVGSVIAGVLGLPGFVAGFFKIRRRRLGYDALSKGMLAAGAGDAPLAQKFANQAGRWLAGDPMTLMLKAQAAQLRGDEVQAERVFRSMLQIPEAELLGLHGLFIHAQRAGDGLAAKKFAQQAFARKPGLPWAAGAVLMLQSASGDWQAAEQTLAQSRDSKLITKAEAARKQAILLCARAMGQEENDDEAALQFALKAHKLAPDLVPSAVIVGRILAAKGQATRAARVLAKTWRLSPHPDLAEVYAATRQGEAPRDRLKRLKILIKKAPGGEEGSIALARAGVEARDWRVARTALAPLLTGQLSARVCALMAEIEHGEFGDKGKVREWLARAVHAPRDPVWTADGFVSQGWLPISPVTGELDRFEWKVPLEAIGSISLDKMDEEDGSPAHNGKALEDFVQEDEPEAVVSDAVIPVEEQIVETTDDAGIENPEELSSSPEILPDDPVVIADGIDKPDMVEAADDRIEQQEAFMPPIPDDPGPREGKRDVKQWLRSFWQ